MVHVGEIAAELHEDGERHEDPGERHECVVEDLVRKARQAERRGYGAEQDDSALVREPLVDEAVRRVVASAFRDRAAFEQANDGDECGVEDGHR